MTPDSNELLARVEAGAKPDAMREALIHYICGDEINGGLVRNLCFTVWKICHEPKHPDGNSDWGTDTLPSVQKAVSIIRTKLADALAAPVPSPDGLNSPALDCASHNSGERLPSSNAAAGAGEAAPSDDVRSALADIPVGLWADRIERTTKLVRVQDADSYRSALYAARIDCFYDFEAKKLVSLLRSLAALRSAPVSGPTTKIGEQQILDEARRRYDDGRFQRCFAEGAGWGLKNRPAVGVTREALIEIIADRIFNDDFRNLDGNKQDACSGVADAILALSLVPDATVSEPLQSRVLPWMLQCFGPTIPYDKTERNHRFLEEALELVQACGCTQDEAHQLVDYVYGRDQGDINQEVGGVMITLAALCIANGFDMHCAGETELARIWTKVEQIRAKQAAKPKHSPLPVSPSPQHVDREATVSARDGVSGADGHGG